MLTSMVRPRRFSDEEILDATESLVAERGDAVTVEDVAGHLGCTPGSLYYRVGTRRTLLARVWLRALARFHADLLEDLRHPDPDTAFTAGAVTVVTFCRRERAAARALTLFRATDLRADPPAGLEDDVTDLNRTVDEQLGILLVRRFGRRTRDIETLATMAVQLTPYSLVRPYLDTPETAIPEWLDEVVRAGVLPMLEVADSL